MLGLCRKPSGGQIFGNLGPEPVHRVRFPACALLAPPMVDVAMITGNAQFVELRMTEYVTGQDTVIDTQLSTKILATIIQIGCCVRRIVDCARLTHLKSDREIVGVANRATARQPRPHVPRERLHDTLSVDKGVRALLDVGVVPLTPPISVSTFTSYRMYLNTDRGNMLVSFITTVFGA